MLFVIKKINVGQFYKEMSKFGYFKKLDNSQNKVAVAGEIG